MSDSTKLTVEERVSLLESEVKRLDKAVDGIPDAVLEKVASGLGEIVAPQIHQLMLNESAAIVSTGCKQLASGVAVGTYNAGKAVVTAPVKACRWGYNRVVELFGYELVESVEDRATAAKATVSAAKPAAGKAAKASAAKRASAKATKKPTAKKASVAVPAAAVATA